MNRVRQGKKQRVKGKNAALFSKKTVRLFLPFALCLLPFALSSVLAAEPAASYFNQGETLYAAGRNSDAVDAFEQAIKHKVRALEAQQAIDRIRKETVERIRNKALTGVSKVTWQNKYYFMNKVEDRVHVGVSMQEIFERDSLNFRPGAIDSLNQLAAIFAKAKSARFDVDVVNEINADLAPDPTLTASQLNAIFSYLSLASRSALPKY